MSLPTHPNDEHIVADFEARLCKARVLGEATHQVLLDRVNVAAHCLVELALKGGGASVRVADAVACA